MLVVRRYHTKPHRLEDCLGNDLTASAPGARETIRGLVGRPVKSIIFLALREVKKTVLNWPKIVPILERRFGPNVFWAYKD